MRFVVPLVMLGLSLFLPEDEGQGERELEAKLFELWNPLWLGAAKKPC